MSNDLTEPMTTAAKGVPPTSWSARSPLVVGAAVLAPVGYLALGVIVVDQVIQVFVSLDGFEPTTAVTRFQFVTALAARTAPLVLGFLIALGAAIAARSERALRVLQWGAVAVATVLGAGGLFLWFDGVAVKRSVGAEDLSAFTTQWLRGQVFSFLGCALFAWLASGARRMR